jgi:hypothetical protein
VDGRGQRKVAIVLSSRSHLADESEVEVRLSDSTESLCHEILAFVRSLRHPLLVDERGAKFSLYGLARAEAEHIDPGTGESLPTKGESSGPEAQPEIRLAVHFGKLLLEFWGGGPSCVRRVEAVERDGCRLIIRARKPAAGPAIRLEIRDGSDAASGDADPTVTSGGAEDRRALRASDRGEFERQLLAMLARQYPGARFERVSHQSNRERTFSGCYTRGLARTGREAWAFLALSEFENPSAVENALAYGLIWLDWLRARTECAQDNTLVSGLRLVLPPAAIAVAARRGVSRRATGRD